MKTHLDCIPCFLRQTLEAGRRLDLDEDQLATLLQRILGTLQAVDWSLPPPVIGRDIHRAIRELTGDADPYLQMKIADTEAALALLPVLEARVAASRHPFGAAVELALAGNIIDAGAGPGWDRNAGDGPLGVLSSAVDEADVEALERAVANAGTILFLADNAGEIVFDRPLLDRLGPARLTVAVRGAPTLNDATLDDARRSGLTERYRVVSNGADTPGTWLDDCSPEFVQCFEQADLVIAKGQGNYETLSDVDRPIVFLFVVKCALLTDQLHVPVATPVVRLHQAPRTIGG